MGGLAKCPRKVLVPESLLLGRYSYRTKSRGLIEALGSSGPLDPGMKSERKIKELHYYAFGQHRRIPSLSKPTD